MDSWLAVQRQNLSVVIYYTLFIPQGVIPSDGLEKKEKKRKRQTDRQTDKDRERKVNHVIERHI